MSNLTDALIAAKLVGGSGGSGDLSIAKLTISSENLQAIAPGIQVVIPIINESDNAIESLEHLETSDTDNSVTLNVPLYKGKLIGFYDDEHDYHVTTTGGVSFDPNESMITVTGDGTLNFANTAEN